MNEKYLIGKQTLITTKMVTVTTVRLKDIKGKDLLYIMIENNGTKEAINVGEKTWNRIEALINSKPEKNEKQLASKVDK